MGRFLVTLLRRARLSPRRRWAGGPALLVGAAEDAVKQPDLVSARAQLDLARLAGLDTVRVTVLWNPGDVEPAAAERRALESLAAAARLTGSASPSRSSTPAAGRRRSPTRRAPSSRVHRLDRPRSRRASASSSSATSRTSTASGCRSSTRTARNAAAPAYLALLAADVRRAEGRLALDRGHRRRARAARDRPAGHRSRHALADEVPARPRRRLPRERAHDCRSWTCSRIHPVRRHELGRRRATRPTRTRTRARARRLRQARRAPRRGVRRHRAAGLDAADPLRRVRRPDDRARPEGGALHRPRAGDDTAGVDEATQAALLPAGDRARVLPAERARDRLPAHRRRDRRSTAGSPASSTPTARPKSSLPALAGGAARRGAASSRAARASQLTPAARRLAADALAPDAADAAPLPLDTRHRQHRHRPARAGRGRRTVLPRRAARSVGRTLDELSFAAARRSRPGHVPASRSSSTATRVNRRAAPVHAGEPARSASVAGGVAPDARPCLPADALLVAAGRSGGSPNESGSRHGSRRAPVADAVADGRGTAATRTQRGRDSRRRASTTPAWHRDGRRLGHSRSSPGFDAIRLTAIWAPGLARAEAGYELDVLRNAVAGADLTGIRIVLSVYHYGSTTTPLAHADARGRSPPSPPGSLREFPIRTTSSSATSRT